MKNIFSYWAPVAAYMIFIFIVSVRPMPEGLPEISNIDKLYHLGAYSIMGLLWVRALGRSSGEDKKRKIGLAIMYAVIISFIFGAFIEFCQSFTTYRSAEVADALANGVGGFLGAFIYGRFFVQR